MSVNPDSGARNSFEFPSQNPAAPAPKRELVFHFPIEIDGGVYAQNVVDVVDAGVECVVAGSSIFHSVNPRAAFEEMRALAHNASAIKV